MLVDMPVAVADGLKGIFVDTDPLLLKCQGWYKKVLFPNGKGRFYKVGDQCLWQHICFMTLTKCIIFFIDFSEHCVKLNPGYISTFIVYAFINTLWASPDGKA
jgi:hypothetical protein